MEGAEAGGLPSYFECTQTVMALSRLWGCED